jgi:hypothetical protein
MVNPQEANDPIWDYILTTRLQPYIDAVRKWWHEVEDLDVRCTGTYTVEAAPPGLMYRFTRTVKRSPIAGVQAFPFLPTGFLQISGIAGGAVKMIERICLDHRFEMDEFTVIEKHNLPSINNASQFVAFVPTDILVGTRTLGKWLYFTDTEIMYLAIGQVTEAMQNKAKLKT